MRMKGKFFKRFLNVKYLNVVTVKFLNFQTPKNFAVIYLKFKQRPFCQNDANGIANSEDPDQTAPLGAVCIGSALFAQTYLSENLGSALRKCFQKDRCGQTMQTQVRLLL